MPLHFAALQGHVDVLRALLACPGVDCNAADGLGMTPLHHAAVNGQEAACMELLSRGARLDPKLGVRLVTTSPDKPHVLGMCTAKSGSCTALTGAWTCRMALHPCTWPPTRAGRPWRKCSLAAVPTTG